MKNIYHAANVSIPLTALNYTLILFMLVIIIGWLVNALENVLKAVLSKCVGQRLSYIAVNYLTFPGTIIHELSHALFGFITGAKITEIRFFDKPSSGRLGHVTYAPRGKLAVRAFQNTVISCAPVVTGLIIISALYTALTKYTLAIPTKVLLFYLMISVICHMSMSNEDIKNYLKGSFILIPMVWFICLVILSVTHL